MEYEPVTLVIVAAASISGIVMSNTMIKKLGRQSILIFFLAVVSTVTLLLIPVNEVLKYVPDKELVHTMWKFTPYCD